MPTLLSQFRDKNQKPISPFTELCRLLWAGQEWAVLKGDKMRPM